MYSTPFCAMHYSSASATALKIFGAEQRTNGSMLSTYTAPLHCIPSSILPLGSTGMSQYANLVSILASNAP